MNINQRKIGSMLSYAQIGISILLSILYTPLLIRLLGSSEHGLYNTVASTISMMSILSLGFGSGYIRYYSKYKKQNDEDSIYKLNGLFLTIFSVIGIVALLCGLFLSFNLKLVFDSGLTRAEYSIARTLMLILTVNLAISFPMSVFGNIISAHEKFVWQKLIGIGKTVFGPLSNMVLLLLGYRSVAIVTASVIISLIVDVIYLFIVLKLLGQKFRFGIPEKGMFAGLVSYTVFIALNIVVDQINSNVDKVLIARYKGATAVSVYSVGYSLSHYYHLFSTSVSGVFFPLIHKMVNNFRDDTAKLREALTNLFVRVGRIQFQILALLCTGVIFFGKPFIHYWAGSGYDDSYYIALILIIPYTVPYIQNLGVEIQRAENNHRFRSIIYTVMAVINFALSIYLCQLYGAIGSAIGTGISIVIANGIIMNIFYHKKCYIDIILFWKNILRISLGLILPCAFGIILNLTLDLYNIVLLFVGIAAYTAVYALSMWFFAMNDYEKDLIRRPLKKILSLFRRRHS
ncbi:MAG: oligosaccharide flippase family protein [Clostridia bacterium]|nr:oligosaccharide flippase family protein [Clostridia bacterium]